MNQICGKAFGVIVHRKGEITFPFGRGIDELFEYTRHLLPAQTATGEQIKQLAQNRTFLQVANVVDADIPKEAILTLERVRESAWGEVFLEN